MKVLLNQKKKALVLVAATSCVIMFLTFIIIKSLNAGINIPTHHLDGAFQTASGLYRIDAGQAPGRDFYPYLGIGPLYLIYPFFKIAGSNLSASVIAAQFITLAVGWLTVSILWQFIIKPRRFLFSLIAGSIVFSVTYILSSQLPSLNELGYAFHTGNSLRPIRAAAPYLIAISIYFLINHYKRGLKQNFLVGFLIGAIMLWSNDFAIPTVFIFSGFYCFYFYLAEKNSWKINIATFSIAVLGSWTFLLSAITAGHPIEILKYNFIDVATDQWWYFGPYGTSTRVFEFNQLYRIVSVENYFPIFVLLFTSFIAARTKNIEDILLSLIGLTCFIGGSLASIGGHLGGYFGGFYYWGIVTSMILIFKDINFFTKKIFLPFNLINTCIESSLFIFVFALLIGTGYSLTAYASSLKIAKNDPGRFYVTELGGYLSKDWIDYIGYARQKQGSKVIEDYWGILSAINRHFSPWPVDSVIHALGSVRDIAKSDLASAEFIISTKYKTSPEWQSWNISQNFWFYDDLLTNWEPYFSSPNSIVWRKIERPREYENVVCNISSDGNKFIIQSDSTGYYKVKLNYSHAGAGRYLLMLRNNISFGADADGYVSLPLNSTSATIPVHVIKNSGNVFDIKPIGNMKIKFLLKNCIAKKILFRNIEVLR